MKRHHILILGLLLFAAAEGSAGAQPFQGNVVNASASVEVQAANCAAAVAASLCLSSATNVYTVPKGSSLLLTQACGGHAVNATTVIVLTDTQLGGPIAYINLPSSEGSCVRFEPGFSLPSGDVISCSFEEAEQASNAFCNISGILSYGR